MPSTILITGAGSGLGEGAAIGLAKNGFAVIAAAQSCRRSLHFGPRRLSWG